MRFIISRPNLESMSRIFTLASLLVLAFALPGCSYFSGDNERQAPETQLTADNEVPPEVMYNEAKQALEEERYVEATQKFAAVESKHPYSAWATRAILMQGYSQYQGLDYTSALITLDRFIDMHPTHESIPYAFYLKSLCYYEQIADVGRDQDVTESARKAFREVIRRFPDTDYARDAQLKLDLTEDHLAGKEMEIGRFYLTRGNLVGAVGRFKYVVDNYQTTMHTPEALHRLVETYLKLGLKDDATETAAVLGYNYPGNKWYARSYELLTGKRVPVTADMVRDDKAWWDIF